MVARRVFLAEVGLEPVEYSQVCKRSGRFLQVFKRIKLIVVCAMIVLRGSDG